MTGTYLFRHLSGSLASSKWGVEVSFSPSNACCGGAVPCTYNTFLIACICAVVRMNAQNFSISKRLSIELWRGYMLTTTMGVHRHIKQTTQAGHQHRALRTMTYSSYRLWRMTWPLRSKRLASLVEKEKMHMAARLATSANARRGDRVLWIVGVRADNQGIGTR